MSNNYVWGPTFEEMLHPAKLPQDLRKKSLAVLDGDPLSSLNLYNINWRDSNDRIRHVILPQALTGVDATICVITGRGFPTGSHKVGATYSCTVERQLAGRITPGKHRLVWPSTGNFGVGGAFVGERMNYESLVVLPEGMSKERFDMIKWYGADFVTTPGSESNVKEIYDKTQELSKEPDTEIVNQFTDFGNYRFHYFVTGNTMIELFDELKKQGVCSRFAGITSAMGSGGTIACGDRVKQVHPDCRLVGLEPIQCPTLYSNGFGSHDIQGIGDKHVTWIHNTDSMDALCCIDDLECKKGMQLLHEDVGLKVLEREGVPREQLEALRGILGISGICNVLGAIKVAKFWKFGRGDIIFTIATDSVSRYLSVIGDMNARLGRMDEPEAGKRLSSIFHGQGLEFIREGTPHARNCWANLKYFTWVEQRCYSVESLRAQRSREYWEKEQAKVPETDGQIRERRGV